MQAISFKCVVIGDGNVGKTSMLISFTQNLFPVEYLPTDFDHYAANLTVDGQTVCLGLWDTAGQEESYFSKINPLSYPQADVIMICFSVTNPNSYDNVLNRWIVEARQHFPTKPVVLIGTKLDLRENLETIRELRKSQQMPISYENGLALANKIRAVTYVECSAFTRQHLSKVFEEAVRVALMRKKGIGGKNKQNAISKSKKEGRTCSIA